MARPWRIEYDGAYYHVLSRGNEGRDIFYDDKDRRVFLEQASRLLNYDVHRFKKDGRLYGEDKEYRDILVFLLWETGAYTNAEIGEAFGVSYTAVSHIVKKVKTQMKANREYKKNYELINSQIKM